MTDRPKSDAQMLEQELQDASPVFEGDAEDSLGSAQSEKDVISYVERILRLVSVTALAIATSLGVWQYFEANKSEQRERALSYMSLWQSGDAQAAYNRLRVVLEIVLADLPVLPDDISEHDLKLVMNGVGADLVAKLRKGQIAYTGDWESDIRTVVNFYNEVEFCTSSELCDRSILKRYFGPDVSGFWTYFEAYATDLRNTYYPGFANGVETLSIEFSEH